MWISYTESEISFGEFEKARGVFRRANKALENAAPQERILMLESWMDFEKSKGNDYTISELEKLMPRKVKRRRQITSADGTDAGVIFIELFIVLCL